MSGSYPRTENDSYDSDEADGDPFAIVAKAVIVVDGHMLGSHSNVTFHNQQTEESLSSHHIVQHAAVKDLEGYVRNDAPAISVSDNRGRKGTEHHLMTEHQKTSDIGGTLQAEYEVAEGALNAAYISEDATSIAMQLSENHFTSLGHDGSTETVVPKNRRGVNE